MLASIRSIGRSKYPIVIDQAIPKSSNRKDRTFKSRFVRQVHFTPDPTHSLQEFKNKVLRLCEKHRYNMILTYGVKTTTALSLFKDELTNKNIIVPFPHFDTLIRAHDKEICLKIAEELSLKTPKTYYHEELGDLLEADLQYPLIIKARRNSGIEKGFARVENEKELITEYHRISSQSGDSKIIDFTRPIVQEFIRGKIYDANFFLDTGQVKGFIFQERVECVRENIGPGIHNRTINGALKEQAFTYGKSLLNAIGWQGSCMVELILDENENAFKLVEINPKLWGTLELSIKAGIDFPLDMIRSYYFGENVQPRDYEEIDFYWLFHYIKTYNKTGKRGICKSLLKILLTKENEFNLFDLKPEIPRILAAIRR